MNTKARQEKRSASFTTPLGEDFFVISRFDGREGLSERFEYRVEALSETEDADRSQASCEECHATLGLRGRQSRRFSGLAAEAGWLRRRGPYHACSFVPRPWLLSRRSDRRTSEQKTAPGVIEETLRKRDFEDRLTDSYETMDYCVRYRETDLFLVLGVTEQHGIHYDFRHPAGSRKLIDSPQVTVKSLSTAIDGDARAIAKDQMITLN